MSVKKVISADLYRPSVKSVRLDSITSQEQRFFISHKFYWFWISIGRVVGRHTHMHQYHPHSTAWVSVWWRPQLQ